MLAAIIFILAITLGFLIYTRTPQFAGTVRSDKERCNRPDGY
jgi:hypothetical protein